MVSRHLGKTGRNIPNNETSHAANKVHRVYTRKLETFSNACAKQHKYHMQRSKQSYTTAFEKLNWILV